MRISGIRIFRPLLQTRSRRLYLVNKEAARVIIAERIRHFNTHYCLPIGSIAIRNQKSRWGSCSKKGNLNFNYKLIFLLPELRDYVIAHEICHLKEFNHSRKFWDLVKQTIPDYRAIRKKLRDVSKSSVTPALSSKISLRDSHPRNFKRFWRSVISNQRQNL